VVLRVRGAFYNTIDEGHGHVAQAASHMSAGHTYSAGCGAIDWRFQAVHTPGAVNESLELG